ncbi:MAG: SpoIID/LytB domain-containing protein, partial [Chloroflexota bacterium]|nr:SpoIID/LytB domain-containing protein [Chloroflexota bacterium]
MRQRFATLAAIALLLSLAVAWAAGPLHAQSPAAREVRLTSFGDAVSLAWSPDASRLLFTRSTSVVPAGQGWQTLSDLWEVPAAGGSATRLAANAACPAYSPDGRSIVFLSFEADGRGRLWLLSGGQRTDLGAADWGHPPTWTRDGASLQIQRDGRPVGVDHQGRVVPGVVSVTGALPAEARGPTASPDGGHVAYLVYGDAGPELWVAGSNGEDRRLVLHGELEFFGRPAWSSDGQTLVVSRTPSGSETAPYAELWLAAADGSYTSRLTNNEQEESLPAWSPDGRGIAFLRGGDLWLRGAAPDVPAQPVLATEEQRRNRPVPPALETIAAEGAAAGAGVASVVALTPPATIRVIHSVNNTCRPDVPVGRIDIISFELYLKWVVPREMGAGQAIEALRAQAVAARSYAWVRVLTHGSWTFDVTDWTEYQAMCPSWQDRRSDAAVDTTTGQYVSYLGAVANAMYSAENSDPTLTNSRTPYLTAVDDPVAFGRSRNGHGWGMSQNGAYRWAGNYGWNYQQILAHYYTGVVIQLPAGGTPDIRPPLGSQLLPWPNWWVNSNRTLLAANASDDQSAVVTTTYAARYFSGTGTVSSTLSTPLWDLTAIPDQAGILVTTTVRDNVGNTSSSAASWGLERSAPTGAIAAPAFTAIPTVTLNLSAVHSGPAGPVSMTLSNDWRWSAALSPLIIHNESSGVAVSDTASLYGTAWMQTKGVALNSRSFGPFISLATGRGYRAWFRLKTSNVQTTSEVAYLEVIDNGTLRVLGLKRVRGIDFRQANVYQDFYVDFYLDRLDHELEFPLTFRGAADLWYDRVMVTTFPAPLTASTTWTVPAGEGPKQVQARYVDGAGNISPDYNATVTMDNTPPTALACSPAVAPAASITVTWSGADALSGVGSYDLQVRDGDGPWTPWLTHTTALSAVFSGAGSHLYSFRARATDNVGNLGAYRDGGDTSTVANVMVATRSLATGWNLVGVAISATTAVTAQDLMEAVAAAGGSAVEVASWQDGVWQVHAHGVPATDFPLEVGRGYFVRAAAPATWGLAGLTYAAPFSRTLTAGWNLVSVPGGSAVTTAHGLAQSIQGQGGTPWQVLR